MPGLFHIAEYAQQMTLIRCPPTRLDKRVRLTLATAEAQKAIAMLSITAGLASHDLEGDHGC